MVNNCQRMMSKNVKICRKVSRKLAEMNKIHEKYLKNTENPWKQLKSHFYANKTSAITLLLPN